ncbi:MAG: TonB-dependent receptor, partial [Flavobacteriaceae bacterium]
LVWYHIATHNDILPYDSASLPSQTLYQNIGETRRTGIEWEVTYQPLPRLRIQANYNRAKNTFENEAFNGNQLPGIAKDFGTVSIRRELNEKFVVTLKRIYRGTILANSDNSVELPKISVTHLEMIWNTNEAILSCGIQNLFDKMYSDNVRINAFGGRFYEISSPRSF